MSLSGCTTTPQIKPNVPFQESLLVKCPEQLPRINGVTGKDLSEPLLTYLDIYPLCAARHNQLVDEINQRKELQQ
ncbi:Rz1-like lysis system protein LysC [Serratia marcescens]|uniref:Rz1-like lysis system protein LysC n=1 Tax=Serratia marcescens TaxID=615 RepID=UPI003C6F7833